MRTQGSPGDVCGGLRDPAQLVLIVREQRMFFGKPENRLSLLRIVTLGLILAGRKPAIPSPEGEGMDEPSPSRRRVRETVGLELVA